MQQQTANQQREDKHKQHRKQLFLSHHEPYLGALYLPDFALDKIPWLQTPQGVLTPRHPPTPLGAALPPHQTELQPLMGEVSAQNAALDHLSHLVRLLGGLFRAQGELGCVCKALHAPKKGDEDAVCFDAGDVAIGAKPCFSILQFGIQAF